MSEECGRTATRVGDAIVVAVEHRRAREPGAFFRMESTYHPCDVTDEVHAQSLDAYEHELAFEPVWVRFDEAIHVNRARPRRGFCPDVGHARDRGAPRAA